MKAIHFETGAAALCLALCAAPALADPVLTPVLQQLIDRYSVQAKNADSFAFDYGIPTSPALTLIGTSNGVSSPSADMKPFVFSVPASWGGSKDAQAFSTDMSIMWVLRQLGSAPQREAYADFLKLDYWGQLAYRTRIEGALYLGDDGGANPAEARASRAAFGFSTSLLANSDPVTVTDDQGRPAWSGCVDDVFNSPKEKELFAAYYGTSDVKQLDAITSLAGAIRAAETFPENTANAQTAIAQLQDCLNGVCAASAGTLPTILTELKSLAADTTQTPAQKAPALVDAYDRALAQIDTMTAKTQTASYATSADLAKQFGIDKALGACIAKANALSRLSPDLDVGAGVVWSGAPGKVERFTDASGAVWIAGRLPIGVFNPDITSAANYGSDTSSLMIGGALRATFGQQVATGVAAMPAFRADVFDGWIGLERYAASSRFAAQVGYIDTIATDAPNKMYNKSGTRWQVSASIRADKLFGGLLTGFLVQEQPGDAPQNGLWVNATYGSAAGTVTTLDDKTVMISLSYSPSEPYAVFGDKVAP